MNWKAKWQNMGSSDTDLKFQFCLLSSLTAIIPSFQIVNPLPFHLTLVSLWCSLSAQTVFCWAWLLESAIKGPQKTAWALRLCGVAMYCLTFSTLFVSLIINEPSDYLSLTRKWAASKWSFSNPPQTLITHKCSTWKKSKVHVMAFLCK